jgi:hypothetical protein
LTHRLKFWRTVQDKSSPIALPYPRLAETLLLLTPYRPGRSPDWLKMKNANAPAVKREAEEDWGKEKWR